MPPKVSIILPFYNCEHLLSDAIESVLAQTLVDFELLLIDNNSIDNSYDIATGFAINDERIKIIDEPRQGIVYALNTGIKHANSSFIAQMDAGNICYPERLEKQLNYLESNTKTGVVSSQVKFIPTSETPEELDGLKHYIIWNNKLITNEDISINRFVESPMVHSSVMFRKELIEQHGGYLNGDFPEDYELWLRWISKGVIMHKLPEILLDWVAKPQQLTQLDEKYTDQAFFEVKSRYMFDWLKDNNQYHPEVAVWGAGRKSRQRFYILHELGIQAKFYIDLRANPERKVIQFQHTPPAGRQFILSYVANRSARENIKIFLVELGYVEGKDFICMA